jgi:hypothetical protein
MGGIVALDALLEACRDNESLDNNVSGVKEVNVGIATHLRLRAIFFPLAE